MMNDSTKAVTAAPAARNVMYVKTFRTLYSLRNGTKR